MLMTKLRSVPAISCLRDKLRTICTSISFVDRSDRILSGVISPWKSAENKLKLEMIK